jgi:hypothetical protein
MLFRGILLCSRNIESALAHCVDNMHSIVMLTFQSLLVTWCNNKFNIQKLWFNPHSIYMFWVYLETKSDFYHIEHKQIGFYNLDEVISARY